MIIVGVGAGPGMLTQEAIETINTAMLIYGSKRAIDLASHHIQPGCSVHVIADYKKLRELPEVAVILSTGDPMLSGLGYLEGRVVPGISSMQLACARLGISQLNVVPITLHGKAMDPNSLARIASEVKSGRCVFLLTDDSTDLAALCRYMEGEGLPQDIAVLTDLGYPEETIKLGRTDNPSKAPGLSCVVIGDLGNRNFTRRRSIARSASGQR
jgi:cobalt-precorrin-7 (C5)-methyltransferase